MMVPPDIRAAPSTTMTDTEGDGSMIIEAAVKTDPRPTAKPILEITLD